MHCCINYKPLGGGGDCHLKMMVYFLPPLGVEIVALILVWIFRTAGNYPCPIKVSIRVVHKEISFKKVLLLCRSVSFRLRVKQSPSHDLEV